MRIITTTLAALVVLGTAVSPAAAQEQDRTIDDVHRGMQVATMSSLVVTGALGTIIAMNKPTLFGDGRCESGDPIFGDYGCKGLSVLHGLSAILSFGLYTITTTIEFVEYDWPGQQDHGTAYEIASWGHLIGMGALPLVGIITAVPEVLGIEGQGKEDFQRILRTLHIGFAYLTVGTYVATAAIDLD